MDNPEILATLDTRDEDEDEENIRTQDRKLKRWAIPIPPIRRVNTSAGEGTAVPASYKALAVLLL